MSFRVTTATAADIPAITSIFAHDEPPPFMQLCLGSVNAIAVNVKQADRIAQALHNPQEKWLIARDGEHNKTASFAEWLLPEAVTDTEVQSDEEMTTDEDETPEISIPPGMNLDLILQFNDEVTKLRQSVLKGKRHYLLMNIGTINSWRRKGAATALVKWPFAAADQANIPVYLDTTSDDACRKLFENCGFTQVGDFNIDLSKYGGQGTHTHVAMIRWPKSHCSSCKEVVV